MYALILFISLPYYPTFLVVCDHCLILFKSYNWDSTLCGSDSVVTVNF